MNDLLAETLIRCALDSIRRAQDGLDGNGEYAAKQLGKAIDYLTRARAAVVPDVAMPAVCDFCGDSADVIETYDEDTLMHVCRDEEACCERIERANESEVNRD